FLALTFGLENDPPAAVERAVGFIEHACRKRDIAEPIRMSVAVSDGRRLWAFRYSTVGVPPSLFFSTKIETLRDQHPEISLFLTLSDQTRMVVSEPLGDLKGAWNEVPESCYGMIDGDRDELKPFAPHST